MDTLWKKEILIPVFFWSSGRDNKQDPVEHVQKEKPDKFYFLTRANILLRLLMYVKGAYNFSYTTFCIERTGTFVAFIPHLI